MQTLTHRCHCFLKATIDTSVELKRYFHVIYHLLAALELIALSMVMSLLLGQDQGMLSYLRLKRSMLFKALMWFCLMPWLVKKYWR